MLARLNRFHGHGSVRRAYRLGRPVRGSMIGMHVLISDKINRAKFAVVVSRKVHKSAVKRNRIRRRIYENIRPRLASLRPAEVVLTVYQAEVLDMSADELSAAIDQLIQKSRLQK